MKKILSIFSIAALLFAAASCNENKEPKAVEITVQLTSDNAALAVEGIPVELVEASGAATYTENTDASGCAIFKVPAGSYSASVAYKTVADGEKLVYSGSVNVVVDGAAAEPFMLALNKVTSPQIIIKELYCTGCPKNETGNYTDDAYIILYNNSDVEADASDIVISLVQPGNGHATNKYYVDDKLLYENENWILAYSAIWWFKEQVKIPAYSQIVIAIFGGIDHTQTVTASVDLSDPNYYWMSNTDISTTFKAAKYSVSNNIPTSHYMTTYPVSAGTAWVLSNNSPALYIGKMDKAAAEALSKDTENYEKTSLTNAKFPKANVTDCVEVWSAANIEKSKVRFSADLNSGHVDLTNNLGHSVYRNVDKEATEELAENAGKIVYNYAGGTFDAATNSGSTDPSGIDAEASIAAGAHIIYKDTNDSGKDFHERTKASIKK